jgi:hypothetical protein
VADMRPPQLDRDPICQNTPVTHPCHALNALNLLVFCVASQFSVTFAISVMSRYFDRWRPAQRLEVLHFSDRDRSDRGTP